MATGIVTDSLNKIRTLVLAHSAAVVLNEVIVSAGKVLIACKAALISTLNAYIYEGVVNMPKATGVSFAPGDKCYWDDSAKKITTTTGGNTLCGICTAVAANADTTIDMFLRQYNTEVTDATADSKAESASGRASVADSKAVSNSVVESTNKSVSDSKAASNSALISTADSKAESNSVVESTNKSVSDSKVTSNSVVESTNKSVSDSKVTSNSVVESTNKSVSDSKATSLSTLISATESKLASHLAA